MSDPRIAVVTGAGAGIGRAVALILVQRGFRVALLGRTEAALHATAEAAPVGTTKPVVTDVRCAESISTAIEATLAWGGRIDLLFNNAGISGSGTAFEDLALSEIEDIVATNLTGAILMAQRVYRAMRDQRPQGGRIINNGSISAHAPRPHSQLYTATKHAITGLTRALSLDGRAYNIACGQIDIGNAATQMTSGMSVGALQPDGTRRQEPLMDVTNVTEAVAMMATMPLEANVQSITVMATTMPFVGRG